MREPKQLEYSGHYKCQIVAEDGEEVIEESNVHTLVVPGNLNIRRLSNYYFITLLFDYAT